MELLIFLSIIIGYYVLGAILNGLMHRYDPSSFPCDSSSVGFVVMAWIIIIPVYWFAIFCDRCIYWFERK